MGYGNLRQWIEQLRKDKDLAVIDTPVDPHLELAEIHRRVVQNEGPALLFTQVKGTPFPVATNLFGTVRRVEKAFGPRPEQLMKSLMNACENLHPPTLSGLWKEKSMLIDLLKVGTKNVSQGEAPVLGICRNRDSLKELPRITTWQVDAGPFVELPIVYTESINRSKEHSLGMYRVQIQDDNTANLFWNTRRTGGGFHHHEAKLSGEALPVSLFIGGPPALMATAIAPVPERVPELLFASMMLGGRLPLVKDPMGGHRIPAEAEFAIRGLVPPNEEDYSVMHIQRMWHRKDAIYPVSLLSKPRQEDHYLGNFLQRLLSPAYPLVMPSVRSLWTYSETGSQTLASAVVHVSYSQETLAAAFRILGEGQLSRTRFLLLTNEPVELSDFPKLLETVLERFNPAGDLLIFNQTSYDEVNDKGTKLNPGSKGIMIGVGSPIRDLPRAYDEGVIPGIHDVQPYCGGCLAASGASYEEDPTLPQRLVAALRDRGTSWPLVILVDNAAETVKTQASFLGSVFTHFNPATDIYAESEVVNHHVGYKLPIVIDARMKQRNSEEILPNEDIVERVNQNWKNYFPTA
ncbi:UbiD family decarboxylase [Paenibacillus wynnii]|uniref:4-hydroxybenzoate decarboxylase n=1 Tax=Paenibacillus wynnii TaxID=268407 RepID=A0A098MFK1_9BACL|nr:UbiD family decarboxylase domain-containing protein [Paenibacillus wynnii]KGE20821.1 4-hydroxybenzoate decarboxylase [Paenibacillus wynnii]